MRYTSDLTDAQWEQIKEYFPAGNKSKYDKREPVNAVLYPVKKGIGEHLKTPLKSFITFGSTFLREFKIRLKSSRFVGRLNGLCRGFKALAAFQKTMRSKLFTLKLCVLFPIFIRCCVGSDFMWTGS